MISQRLVEDGIIEGNSILTLPEGDKSNEDNGENGYDNGNNSNNSAMITAVEKAALRSSQRVKSPVAIGDGGGGGEGNANTNTNEVGEGMAEEVEEERSVEFSQKLQQWMKSTTSFLFKVGSHYVYRGVFLVCLLLDLLFLSLAILGFNEYRLW